MNKIILIGRLAREPELKYTQSGTAVCTFTLAVDKGLTKQKRDEAQAQGRPTADFPRIIVFGKMAENASKYLNKGSQGAVEGRIQTGSYQDKNGNTVYTTDVVADRVEFLNGQNSSQNNAQQNNNQNRSNYTNNQNNFNTGQNNDYFDDDFEPFDDGRIPF